jgi:hypothetical protein
MRNKYNIGDKVHCYRPDTKQQFGFNFKGMVIEAHDTGEGWEYAVTNAPPIPGLEFLPNGVIIWEHEMEKL